MKSARMVAIFVATITTAILSTAQTVHAQTKKVDIPIYQRCEQNPFLLSVETYEGECIVGKHHAQNPKKISLTSFPLLPTPTPAKPQRIDLMPTPTVVPVISYSPVTPTSASATITPAPVTPTGSLNADVLFDMVNTTRAQNGLPAFEKDDNTCSIAQQRLPQIYDEIMVNHNMHAGFYGLHLPYWATENLIYQQTEAAALNWWMNEPIHRAAILSDNKFSCVACTGDACTEIFTNYLPK